MKDKQLPFTLSPLEKDILNVVWTKKKLRVREIFDHLKGKRKVALSSVAVILDRLYIKQIVDREVESGKGGMRYIYFPTKNKKQFENSVIEETVNTLIQKFGRTAVSYFNERFGEK